MLIFIAFDSQLWQWFNECKKYFYWLSI